MLGLPQSTEVKRPLPKAQLFKRFDWKPSQRESFDADVSRLDFVNWIAPRTLPAISEGVEVKEIFVIEVSLKTRDFDTKTITLLAKSIPQKVIYLLRFEEDYKIAVSQLKLFITDWIHAEGMSLQLTGLGFDAVWENFVRQIAGTLLSDSSNLNNEDAAKPLTKASGLSLNEEIIAADKRAKIIRQIELLEHQMRSSSQPRRQRELYAEIKKLKHQITS